jgi:hypothetical protein
VTCFDPLKYEISLSKVAATATAGRSMSKIKAEISIEAMQKDRVCPLPFMANIWFISCSAVLFIILKYVGDLCFVEKV